MTVRIGNKALTKMKNYAQKLGNDEIGGLVMGSIHAGDVEVEDVNIMKQEKSVGTFSIDDEDMMDLTKNSEPDFLKSVIGWWHSHGRGFTFFSGTDNDTFERLCNFSGFCIGVVVAFPQHFAKKGKWLGFIPIKGKTKESEFTYRTRVDVLNKNGERISIDEINAEVGLSSESVYNVNHNEMEEEIKSKVRDSHFGGFGPPIFDIRDKQKQEMCPTCHGEGFVGGYEICGECEGAGYVEMTTPKINNPELNKSLQSYLG